MRNNRLKPSQHVIAETVRVKSLKHGEKEASRAVLELNGREDFDTRKLRVWDFISILSIDLSKRLHSCSMLQSFYGFHSYRGNILKYVVSSFGLNQFSSSNSNRPSRGTKDVLPRQRYVTDTPRHPEPG